MELKKEQYERISECFPKQKKPAKIIRPCFKNDKAMCYFNKIAIAAIWMNAKNEESSLS